MLVLLKGREVQRLPPQFGVLVGRSALTSHALVIWGHEKSSKRGAAIQATPNPMPLTLRHVMSEWLSWVASATEGRYFDAAHR
jgi:hypothetical protein